MDLSTLKSTLMIFLVLVATSAAIGCDRDDDSPSVTVGSAPETQSEPPPEQPDDSAQDPAEIPTPEADRRADYDPELPDGTAEQQTLFTQARTKFLLDEYEEAEELFEQLAFDEPVTGETVSAAIALGQIYIETGRSEEALELFTELQDHVDEIPEVLLVLARVYADLDHPGLALEAYDRAYEHQADYIFILTEMAQLLLETDQDDRAAELLMRYEERLERMVKKLEDPDETSEHMRVYLVDIIGLLHDERAHEALANALADDPAEPIRLEAATALGELAAFDAEDALRRSATEDSAESVRVAARHSLGTLRQLRQQMEQSDQ